MGAIITGMLLVLSGLVFVFGPKSWKKEKSTVVVFAAATVMIVLSEGSLLMTLGEMKRLGITESFGGMNPDYRFILSVFLCMSSAFVGICLMPYLWADGGEEVEK